jgi:patatin-related protein
MSSSPTPRAREPRHLLEGDPGEVTTTADSDDADVQDLRVAVVLNGGVSLAVWISGVVIELNRLVQGSRAPADRRRGDVYAELLDLLRARARIDVVAGTSAGGLNGGFLALGLVRGADLSMMRDLWRDQGDLSTLLRDPREKGAPSLLRGQYFHEQLAEAYERVVRSCTGRPAPADEHVDLYLTGTLWDGRRSTFTDDMGRPLVEVDHDATFHFSSDPTTVGTAAVGNLGLDAVAAQLAVASRCTSSFPGAFEPFRVEVAAEAAGDRWPSTAGLANFSSSQFVVDGGVLRNKPVRPALEAVYRQSASRQVRRVMAYVVPDPGESAAPPSPVTAPGAAEVLLGVLTRLRSTDSVAGELAEIELRNDQARRRRRTRDRLAGAFLDASVDDGLVAAAYPAYREVRNEAAADDLSARLRNGASARRWSRDELATVIREIAASAAGLPFVPPEDLATARSARPDDWRWGHSAVRRLGDLTLDVLKRAVWLAPIGSRARVEIVAARSEAHEVLTEIREDRRRLDDYWREAGRKLPDRREGEAAAEEELQHLRSWVLEVIEGWETTGGRRRVALHAQADHLASSLWSRKEALEAVVDVRSATVDPSGEEQERLRSLTRVLFEGATSADDVLLRMLDLEVVQVAFGGAAGDVEQEVELVQISSERPELLTGIQQHHFGAFYRASWRCNDWLRGRLDGSEQLVQVLLEPERLRQLLDPSLSERENLDRVYARLRSIAGGPATERHSRELLEAWDEQAEALRTELEVLYDADPLPRTFPLIAARIAARLHAQLLEDELVALAESVLGEEDRLEPSEHWALRVCEAAAAGPMSLTTAASLARGSEAIGRQRISTEMDGGTDTFARTMTHAAASTTSMLASLPGPRLVSATLTALRGYALLVWVLVNRLTTRSANGRNVLSLTVGVGAALVALTLVMPGVPVAVTLAGAGLLLAATTATAMTQHSQVGWSLAVRTAVACSAVLLGLAGAVAYDLSRDREAVVETLLRGAGRVAVVAAVVAVGWFVARAKPGPARAARPRSAPTRPGVAHVPQQATGAASRVVDLRDESLASRAQRVGSG